MNFQKGDLILMVNDDQKAIIMYWRVNGVFKRKSMKVQRLTLVLKFNNREKIQILI